MNRKQQIILLSRAKDFFKNEIVDTHINKACQNAGILKNYNVNPFLYKYLANFLQRK